MANRFNYVGIVEILMYNDITSVRELRRLMRAEGEYNG